MTATPRPSDLQRLMTIADRYASKLVAEGDLTSGVLLIGRADELTVVGLDGPGLDAMMVRRLLTLHRATSAALIVEIELTAPERILCTLGETAEGATDGRVFRIRPCGRRRRLTARASDDQVMGTLPGALFASPSRPRAPAAHEERDESRTHDTRGMAPITVE
jgi:hypothetical protein